MLSVNVFNALFAMYSSDDNHMEIHGVFKRQMFYFYRHIDRFGFLVSIKGLSLPLINK